MHAYCAHNDILIKAPSLKAAKTYAQHRLSPAYGHAAGRADTLDLRIVSAADADTLEGGAIVWEVEE